MCFFCLVVSTGFDSNKFRLAMKVYSFEGSSLLVLLTAWKVLWCITVIFVIILITIVRGLL